MITQRKWELVVSACTIVNILLYGQSVEWGAITGVLLLAPWGGYTWWYKLHGLWPLNIVATGAHLINYIGV